MKPKEFFTYVIGADYLKKHLDHQDRLLADKIGNKGPHLPFDAGIETAAQVYSDRLRVMFEYPIVVIGRITCVDLILKKLAEEKKTH